MNHAQAPYARVPLADGTLVATAAMPDDDLIPSLLVASDVLGTGWYADGAARIEPGSTAMVVGDGAVGLIGVLAAKQMGAERIITTSRHETRQDLVLEFGATDIVSERGNACVARITELTNNVGTESVLECVGTRESMMHGNRLRASRRPAATRLSTGGFVSAPSQCLTQSFREPMVFPVAREWPKKAKPLC